MILVFYSGFRLNDRPGNGKSKPWAPHHARGQSLILNLSSKAGDRNMYSEPLRKPALAGDGKNRHSAVCLLKSNSPHGL